MQAPQISLTAMKPFLKMFMALMAFLTLWKTIYVLMPIVFNTVYINMLMVFVFFVAGFFPAWQRNCPIITAHKIVDQMGHKVVPPPSYELVDNPSNQY